MNDAVGRVIGRYQLLDVIGQGGMGIVYRGVDTSIDRAVAIKMLHGAYAEDKDLLVRFHREARSTANLQHKNIVTVFALDDFEGSPYMVMEYLEGQSMAEMIKARRPLRYVEKIGLVCQVCEGLQYAHERNLVHRDIKPANVLVLKDGVAKIVDFGIARGGVSETLTQTGQIIGSMHYMSPEQISGAPLDARTDIYSTGVLLYQFLTGELPFRETENDAQATFIRILQEPAPSLGKHLSEFPAGLDEIIAKAMAKNPDERFQTAEDFGYELSRLQESLKRGMTREFLAEANAAVERKDWELARTQLQEVLKFERRNAEANELLAIVRQEIQRQQRSVQLGQLRSQAQIALAGQRYEEALECVEQARRLDPNDPEVQALANSVKEQVARERTLAEALRQGHAALYAGDLGGAEVAVRKALAIEEHHTEARALEGLIGKELAERARRAQYKDLLEEARREIAGRNFLSALHALRKAQEIDPADASIRELLNWAARGHEQEKQRKELQETTNSIGQMLGNDLVTEALEAANTALQRFPQDPSLLELQQLAKRQHDAQARRRAADEASAEARLMVDAGRNEEAIAFLIGAIARFPEDPNLETLLAMTQAEAGRRLHGQDVGPTAAFSMTGDAVTAASPAPRVELEFLVKLEQGLAQRRPLAQQRLLAERVTEASTKADLSPEESARYTSALAEFKRRSEALEQAAHEMDGLYQSMREVKGSAEIGALLDRAHFLAEQGGKEDEIQVRYVRVRQFAEELKHKRQDVSREISELLRSMQANQNTAGLEGIERRIREVAAFWMEDDFIRSLVTQASVYLDEVRQRKNQLLQEITQLGTSVPGARSAGQIRLLEEQAKMLAAESDDPDIGTAVQGVSAVAEARLQRLDTVVSQLKDLTAKVASAPALAQVEECNTVARKLVQQETDTEEVEDLLRRMERSVEDRKREYRRICTNLERLVDSSGKATGKAELDLILAQSRDLLKQYATDPHFQALEVRLESSVTERRQHLTQAAPAPELETEDELLSAEIAGVTPVTVPTAVVPARAAASGLVWKSAVLVGAGLAAGTAWFASGRPVTLTPEPAGATVAVDGQPCGTPCTVRLRPGTHEVAYTRSGFKDLHQTVAVPWMGSGPIVLPLAMTAQPENVAAAPLVNAAGPAPVSGKERISIDTKVPEVSVFLDGRFEGYTSRKGQLTVATINGSHELRVEKQGFKDVPARVVNVNPNATVNVPFTLEPGASSALTAKAGPTQPLPAPPMTTAKPVPGTAAAPGPAAPQPLPAIKLSASAESVVEGQPVTLSWHTDNASEVAIDGIGTVETSGSRQLNLTHSSTFRLVAKGPAGSAAESLHVEVVAPPKAAAAAAPAAPPAAAPASATVSPVDVDRQGVKAALHRYKDAYESESLDDMKKSWPGISKEQQKGLHETFKYNAIRLDLSYQDDDIHVTGNEASVNCREMFSYTLNGKKMAGPASAFRIGLRKEGGTWVIASVSER